MKRFFHRHKKLLVPLAALLTASLVGGTWLARDRALSWYYVRALGKAPETERDQWVERIVGLESAAVPGLIGLLDQDDARACDNARVALERLSSQWGLLDPRTADLACRLVEVFPRLSLSGQNSVVRLQLTWLRPGGRTAPAPLLEVGRRLMLDAARLPGVDVRTGALQLAAALLAQSSRPDLAEKCRDVVRQGLRDAEPEVRTAAVRLAQQPALSTLEQVVPLLHDPSAEVRRAAMLTVGPVQSAIGDEDLLPWLHDSDADVRRLCEVALRGRNVSEENLRLGRQITDPRHAVRLQAIQTLLEDADRDPSEWFLRLSHDPVASVRLAAIQAATRRPRVNLRDRIEQMTRVDPSPTVAQLAQYYLECQKQHKSPHISE